MRGAKPEVTDWSGVRCRGETGEERRLDLGVSQFAGSEEAGEEMVETERLELGIRRG